MPSVFADFPLEWRKYRRRRNWLLGFVLGFPLAAVLVAWPLSVAMRSEIPGFVVAAAVMLGAAGSNIAFVSWPCPKCGLTFHKRGFYCNHLARRCIHCGLPKTEPSR